MLRIKSAEFRDLPRISDFCENDVLGTKIMCQIKAYGLDRDFLSVWYCLTDENRIVAVICKFEDSITLLCKDRYCVDDIRTFISMIGYASVCTSYDTALQMGNNDFVTRRAYMYKGSYGCERFSELTEEYYRDSYNLISRSIPDSFGQSEEAYLNFLSDFTFRKRRNLARIKGCEENGTVYSCALTSAETEAAAIISGVACDLTKRKNGLGKMTVLSLAEELKSENKDVYVIALNESAEGFYEHIGFEFTGKISFIERK